MALVQLISCIFYEDFMSVPAKSLERIKASLKKFQPILQSAKSRDVNESDTVVIVTNMLDQVFGYDVYSEITSEYAIRGTYCDLAVKLDGELAFLIEVKAIGLDLKDQHVKQAIDYAANQGIEWVGLTNGIIWRIYKVGFGKPITFEIVVELNMLEVSAKDKASIDLLSMIAKEGRRKSKLEDYHSYRQVLNRFTVGNIVMAEAVVSCIRKELRRIAPEVKVSEQEITNLLLNEVIKREVIEGEKAIQAQKLMAKAGRKAAKKARDSADASNGPNELAIVQVAEKIAVVGG
jgi:predicted type IV restriction endonuclease